MYTTKLYHSSASSKQHGRFVMCMAITTRPAIALLHRCPLGSLIAGDRAGITHGALANGDPFQIASGQGDQDQQLKPGGVHRNRRAGGGLSNMDDGPPVHCLADIEWGHSGARVSSAMAW